MLKEQELKRSKSRPEGNDVFREFLETLIPFQV
jgi:hypothetical protein